MRDAGGVGEDLDAGADFFDFGRGFEDVHVVAGETAADCGA